MQFSWHRKEVVVDPRMILGAPDEEADELNFFKHPSITCW